MIVLDTLTALRPADDISTMLRQLADEIEASTDVRNVFLVIEHEDTEEPDVRGFGPEDDPFRTAGFLMKAARDILP